jgi:hypothetical protein
VQEKRQEHVDVAHISKDVITVLGKRWDEDLEKLGEDYLKTGGKPVESSDSTSSSSSAPLPDHGSTNIEQPPAPNPASSTANPDPLMEPSSRSSSAPSMQGLWARGNYLGKMVDELWSYLRGDDMLEQLHPLKSPWQTPYHALTEGHAPHPPSADPNFDWEHWMNVEDTSPRPPSPKEFGNWQGHKYHLDPLNPPSTSGYAPSPPEPKQEVVAPSPPSSDLGPPTEPEDEAARQAALYAAKGKAKVSRRISGTATDVGNAAQRELQPAGSYLV